MQLIQNNLALSSYLVIDGGDKKNNYEPFEAQGFLHVTPGLINNELRDFSNHTALIN